MNKKDFEYCKNLVEKTIKDHNLEVYYNEMNLAKIMSAGISEYSGGGTIAITIKAYMPNSEKQLFSFQYENFEFKDQETQYIITFMYNNFVEIKAPTVPLFQFALNDCISNLNKYGKEKSKN